MCIPCTELRAHKCVTSVLSGEVGYSCCHCRGTGRSLKDVSDRDDDTYEYVPYGWFGEPVSSDWAYSSMLSIYCCWLGLNQEKTNARSMYERRACSMGVKGWACLYCWIYLCACHRKTKYLGKLLSHFLCMTGPIKLAQFHNQMVVHALEVTGSVNWTQ